jgi:hypothetical protein
MRIPGIYKFIIKFVTPAFLLIIFLLFVLQNVFGWNYSFSHPQFNPTAYVKDLVGSSPNFVARLSLGWIVIITVFSIVLVNIAGKNWVRREANPNKQDTSP